MNDIQMPQLKELSLVVRCADHSHVEFDLAEPIQSIQGQFSKAA